MLTLTDEPIIFVKVDVPERCKPPIKTIFLALIAVFPIILFRAFNEDISYSLASFYGGTSLLIIVGVALDTLQQVESHMLMRNYDGFLNKGKIRGRSRRY